MPRIAAPTVAEHRARQLRALLDAARDLALEQGLDQLTLSALSERTGLARPSIYRYFTSRDELIALLAGEELPRWTAAARTAVSGARSPAEQLTAFVRSQLEMAAGGSHRLAVQLLQGAGQRPHAEGAPHERIAQALVPTLGLLGHPDPERGAALVQGVVAAATVRIEAGDDPTAVIDAATALVLHGALSPPRA